VKKRLSREPPTRKFVVCLVSCLGRAKDSSSHQKTRSEKQKEKVNNGFPGGLSLTLRDGSIPIHLNGRGRHNNAATEKIVACNFAAVEKTVRAKQKGTDVDTPFLEHVFLDNTTSTDPSAVIFLEPGDWKFSVSGTAADGYSVGIEDSRKDTNTWRNVSSGGAPLALVEADPSKVIRSGGEDFRVTRSTGVAACTVVATLVPAAIREP